MNSDIHHITDEMVEKDGISEEEFYKKIKEIITDDAIVVAYNTQFDINFLRTMYKRYEPDYEIENDLLDVMAIYKDRHKYPHKLDNAVEMYNVNVKNTHRALDDVLATYEVFKKLAIENNNINKYINKFGYNPKYGVSGKRFKQVTYIPQKGGNNEIIS